MQLTSTGASMVRETLPPSLAPINSVEGDIGQPGMLRTLVLVSDLDKGLLQSVDLLGQMFVADMGNKLGPEACTDDARAHLRDLVLTLGCAKHRRDNLNGPALALFNVLQDTKNVSTYDLLSTKAGPELLAKVTGGRSAENVFPVKIFSRKNGATRSDSASALAECLWAVCDGTRNDGRVH